MNLVINCHAKEHVLSILASLGPIRSTKSYTILQNQGATLSEVFRLSRTKSTNYIGKGRELTVARSWYLLDVLL